MQEYSIRDRCHINTNRDSDTFVGIKCEGDSFSVNFPLGFSLATDEKAIRRDIILMLNSIATTTGKKDSQIFGERNSSDVLGFPFQAYMYIIANYLNYGYYKEKETHYHVANRGKINWNRTLKTQKPYIQGTEAYYLKFVTRENPVSDNEMITLIHEYCVYDSFEKLGWLFTLDKPNKPRIKLNRRLFKTVIQDKLYQTYRDEYRDLFKNMLAIIDWVNDSEAPKIFKYGTEHFEYVWEALVDRVYGIKGKHEYFPKTTWKISDGTSYNNSELEPDTIMLWNGNIYVLDAKYYKYGMTRKPGDLPESTSINKQITYAEYIAEQDKFHIKHGESYIVYNAFIMPYDAKNDEKYIEYIGEAISDWKHNNKMYERVQGILVDVKHLMRVVSHQNQSEILKLADIIENSLKM